MDDASTHTHSALLSHSSPTCLHVVAQIDGLDSGPARGALFRKAANRHRNVVGVRRAVVRHCRGLQNRVLRHGLIREAGLGDDRVIDGNGGRDVVKGKHDDGTRSVSTDILGTDDRRTPSARGSERF